MPWVLRSNRKLDKRNPYGQIIGNLIEEALRTLNTGPVGGKYPTARSERHGVGVVIVPPANGVGEPYLRLARIVTAQSPLVQCALALSDEEEDRINPQPVMEGPPIPLKMV